MAQPADPIRRPAPVTPTSPIAASSSAAIGGSVWPTRSGSVPPVLDTAPPRRARAGRARGSGRLPRGRLRDRTFCDEHGDILGAIRMARAPEPNKRTLRDTLAADLLALVKQAPHLKDRLRDRRGDVQYPRRAAAQAERRRAGDPDAAQQGPERSLPRGMGAPRGPLPRRRSRSREGHPVHAAAAAAPGPPGRMRTTPRHQLYSLYSRIICLKCIPKSSGNSPTRSLKARWYAGA